MSDDNASDGSEYSDDDYNPDNDLSEKGSEIESDDDVEDQGSEGENTNKKEVKGKRRSTQKSKKSSKRKKVEEEVQESEEPEPVTEEIDEEKEKERANALWADFLSDTGGSTSTTTEKVKKTSPQKKEEKKPEKKEVKPKEIETKTVTEIFEFAGEEVRVEKEVKVPVASSKEESKKGVPSFGRNKPVGGLGAVLGAINKKNKLSVLDKSKLDWSSYKTKEGINEEIETFNRGKNGFLEKQDFLERTDLRQFEIEKGLRQTKRSNR